MRAGSDDFEKVYSKLAQRPEYLDLCRLLDEAVRSYFAALGLPDAPTVYDLLLLSLRPKDVIATFNWDPLLPQAVAGIANEHPCRVSCSFTATLGSACASSIGRRAI